MICTPKYFKTRVRLVLYPRSLIQHYEKAFPTIYTTIIILKNVKKSWKVENRAFMQSKT